MYTDKELADIVQHLHLIPDRLALHEIQFNYSKMGLEIEYEVYDVASFGEVPMQRLLIKGVTNKLTVCGDHHHIPVASDYGDGYFALVCSLCHRVLATHLEDN